MRAHLRPAIVLFVALSLLTGAAYPGAVTGLAQWLFPTQAAGSLVTVDGRVVGSALIGQSFSDPRDFWGRPSATGDKPYDASNSSGSNLGPLNPALVKAVQQRVAALRAADPGQTAAVPVDLVTASASGLDPDISRAAADFQVQRVARLRGLPPALVQGLVERQTRGAWAGWLGAPRVNVLMLNIALDGLGGSGSTLP